MAITSREQETVLFLFMLFFFGVKVSHVIITHGHGLDHGHGRDRVHGRDRGTYFWQVARRESREGLRKPAFRDLVFLIEIFLFVEMAVVLFKKNQSLLDVLKKKRKSINSQLY